MTLWSVSLLRKLAALALAGLCTGLAATAPAQEAPTRSQQDTASRTLQLGPGVSHDVWERASILADPDGSLGVEQALAHKSEFAPAGRMGANLGKRKGAVWVHVRLQAAAAPPSGPAPPQAPTPWLLDIDYPSLDRIDVYLLDGGHVHSHARLGDLVPMAQRPIPSRSHTVLLDLPPGQTRDMLVRVQTTGSMLVPMALHTPVGYALIEAKEQALQGLFAGAGLCLLLYSLTQWASLRDSMFGWYALTLAGTTAFFAALSGFGVNHLWGGNVWLTQNGPPFFILLGVCGAFLFVLRALEVDQVSPRVARVVRLCGALAGITALLFLADVLDYATAQTVGMALGPTPLLLVLPTAFKRLRAGDAAARWVLVGWGVYSAGVMVLVGVLRGALPVNFFTLHAFQFASLIEMAMWMAVLGERVQTMRRNAALVHSEHEHLQAQAHTDALTGLLNRRGLAVTVGPRLALCTAQQPMAVFLLDLDGFKPINDSMGHEAGDLVLQGVAQRLQANLRGSDLVCRLGGDEFVLAVGPLTSDAEKEAQAIGAKLLKAFEQPFSVGGNLCRVGLTIGYALAPQDDSSLDNLLKRADTAMYAGKQAGRGCVRRGGSSVVLSSS